MSYFDPKIYNKQNLHEKDRAELSYWAEAFNNVIGNSVDQFLSEFKDVGLPFLEKAATEITEAFSEILRENIGYALQDTCVGMIEAYDEEIKEVEIPDTYLYNMDSESEDSKNE